MKRSLLALLLAYSFPALGCYVPPAEQYTPPDNLIERSDNIVLAKVVEAITDRESFEVIYTLETIKTIKGGTSGQFQITGHPAIWEGANRNFNHHAEPQFWSERGGRSQNGTDCKIHPVFSVGATYLVFPDQPYHVKSFEIIIRTGGDLEKRDKWLQYVETRTGP